MASTGGGCYPEGYVLQGCWVYDSAIQLRDDLLLARPNYAVGHEYGHVWENYYRWTNWSGNFDAYLQARGLLGDDRLGSSKCWQPYEIIAEDYRQLFGSGEALTLTQCNKDIPAAQDVPGLLDFLATTWTDGHPPPSYAGGSTATTPTATSVATPTQTPVAPTRTATAIPMATATPRPPTPTRTATPTLPPPTPIPAATPTALPPTPIPTATPTLPPPAPTPTATPTSTSAPAAQAATITLGRGWHSFVAPLSGVTDVTVYEKKGKGATGQVTQGKTYWAKGPITITITAQ